MKPSCRLSESTAMQTVVAIASGGGHWVQLGRLRPALDELDVHYVSVDHSYAAEVGAARLSIVRDASRWTKLDLVVQGFQVLWILLRTRPDVVVSTGASPGFFGMAFGKMVGAKTVWIDSLANVERMSLSGRLARPFSDLWLTQWPHLEHPGGPKYAGAVL